LNYANESNLFGLVAHFHNRIEDWISAWALNVDQQRALFRIVSSALEKDGQHSSALRILTRYFQTFKSETKLSADVEQLMKTAVINAINSPVDSFQDRVILLESFAGQKSAPQLATLLTLLKIICDGSLDDFSSFKQNNANNAQFKDYAINWNDIEYKMKLLTLCSLAATATNKSLPYGTIATGLKIDQNDVEEWIIDAIGQNLIDGSMDQMTATLTVT
jgi:translation initiation factor 3 subunit M